MHDVKGTKNKKNVFKMYIQSELMNAAINDNCYAHCTVLLVPASFHQLGTRPPDTIIRNDVRLTCRL